MEGYLDEMKRLLPGLLVQGEAQAAERQRQTGGRATENAQRQAETQAAAVVAQQEATLTVLERLGLAGASGLVPGTYTDTYRPDRLVGGQRAGDIVFVADRSPATPTTGVDLYVLANGQLERLAEGCQNAEQVFDALQRLAGLREGRLLPQEASTPLLALLPPTIGEWELTRYAREVAEASRRVYATVRQREEDARWQEEVGTLCVAMRHVLGIDLTADQITRLAVGDGEGGTREFAVASYAGLELAARSPERLRIVELCTNCAGFVGDRSITSIIDLGEALLDRDSQFRHTLPDSPNLCANCRREANQSREAAREAAPTLEQRLLALVREVVAEALSEREV